MPLVVSSLSLLPPSSALVEHPSLLNQPSINILEPESANILMDPITSDVQPLSSPPIESAARVVVNNLPLSSDLHD